MKIKAFIKKMIYQLKRFFHFVLRSFRQNMFLKIASILFAVILWSYVIASENPTRTLTLKNIPISYTNESLQTLKERGLTIEKSSLDQTVTVKISAGQNVHKNITESTVSARIDVSNITSAGTYNIPVNVSIDVAGASERSIDPSTVEVVVDDLVEREIPIRYEWKDGTEFQEGYYVETPVLEETSITVSGGSKRIRTIEEGIVVIDRSELTESTRKSYTVKLVKHDGEEVPARYADDTVPSVIVEINVLRRKTVPIVKGEAIDAITNVKEGFEVTDITFEGTSDTTNDEYLAMIEIAGDEETIASIGKVQLKMTSVENADDSILLSSVELEPIDGVLFINQRDNKVSIYVHIQEKQTEKTFENLQVEVRGSNNRSISIEPQYVRVTVRGGISLMEKLNRNNVVAYVDLADITSGTHELELKLDLSGEEGEVKADFSADSITVTIP